MTTATRSRPVRRSVAGPLAGLLLAGLLVLGVVPGTLAPASAARCTAPGVKTATRQATAVFIGTVESASTNPSSSGSGATEITHSVRVSGVWKGGTRISSDDVEVVTTSNTRRGCPLGKLPEGSRYVFFARADGDGWRVARDDGTAPATAALTDRLDRIYGAAQPPVSPTPQPAVFTAADTSAPLSLGRAAAPGAALVLIGLLGLVVVRRANRASR